jgi:hypothetical protein
MTKSQHTLALDASKCLNQPLELMAEQLLIDVDKGIYDTLVRLAGNVPLDTYESYAFFAKVYLQDKEYFDSHPEINAVTHPELFI